MSEPVEFSLSEDELWEVLRGQEVTPEQPGTILRDVETVLDAIGTKGVPTKSKQGNLPSAMLADLNARLEDPVKLDLKRPLLRDYPNLAGVYILLRLLGLVSAERARVRVEASRLETWQSLNSVERYFALFTAWLFDANGEVLGGESRSRWRSPVIDRLLFLMSAFGRDRRWEYFEEHIHTFGFQGMAEVPAWSAQLMMRFGLIDLRARPLDERKDRYSKSRGWMMKKARRTEWGEAVTWAILERLAAGQPRSVFQVWASLPDEEPASLVKSVFQPYFPELQKDFAPPSRESRPGVYIFKAGYQKHYGPSRTWRRLAVPHRKTLHDLVYAVLEAFDFWDDEHLYSWTVKESSGRKRSFVHPLSDLLHDNEEFADSIAVGDLDLPDRATLDLLYDYGNTWEFTLRLERIDPPDPNLDKIKQTASVGKSLPQYPGDEE